MAAQGLSVMLFPVCLAVGPAPSSKLHPRRLPIRSNRHPFCVVAVKALHPFGRWVAQDVENLTAMLAGDHPFENTIAVSLARPGRSAVADAVMLIECNILITPLLVLITKV